jgi:hypothetical protein
MIVAEFTVKSQKFSGNRQTFVRFSVVSEKALRHLLAARVIVAMPGSC